MMENREWCYTYFFMLLLCSISGNIWNRKYEVKNFHHLFQLMKGFKKKMININLVDTREKWLNIHVTYMGHLKTRKRKNCRKITKSFYLTEYTRYDDSEVMSHSEIIKLLVCLENTGTLWWMTQYEN